MTIFRWRKKTYEKIQVGDQLSDAEKFALEAIIIPDKRSAINIVKGDYTVSHPDWLTFFHHDLRRVDGERGALTLDPDAGPSTIAQDGMITQGDRQIGAIGRFSLDTSAKAPARQLQCCFREARDACPRFHQKRHRTRLCRRGQRQSDFGDGKNGLDQRAR